MSFWQLDRVRQAELMDDPELPAAEHLAALDALATISGLSFTSRQIAGGVRAILGHAPAARPVRIVDVACGGGDLTIALAQRLSRRLAADGLPAITILGIDISKRAIDRARQRSVGSPTGLVDFAVRDVLAEGCPPCDIAISSLFLHHLDDGPAESVLRSMAAAARLGGVISDLVRSRLGLALAILGTRLLTRSRVAMVDGPLSVRAARTPAEYRRLADSAGLPHAQVRRVWPERVTLVWETAEPVEDLIPSVACA